MSSLCSAPVAPLTEAVIMATKWSCIYGNGFSWLPQMENFYLCMWMATTLPNAFTRYCPLATIVIVYLDTTLWFISIQRICINVSGKGLIWELWIRQNESVIAIFHELIFFYYTGATGVSLWVKWIIHYKAQFTWNWGLYAEFRFLSISVSDPLSKSRVIEFFMEG